jgi:hypothetical protein
MKPQTPIIPGHDLPVTNFAESQDEYQTLPAFRQDDGTVLTRWRLTWKERLTIFLRGDLYVFMLTFNKPLQPISMQVEPPVEGRSGVFISWWDWFRTRSFKSEAV